MPIPFEKNPSPVEILQEMILDLSKNHISAFAIAVSYQDGQRENYSGVFNQEKDRLIPLIPDLEKLLNDAKNQALSDLEFPDIMENKYE